jgi:predicted esterase
MFDIRYKKDQKYADEMLIILPGRGSPPEMILDYYTFWNQYGNLHNPHLNPHLIKIEINPLDEWYPTPYGSNNQKEAVAGVASMLLSLDAQIKELQDLYKIKRNQVFIFGFSAGAVMALQLAMNSDEKFGGVVAHSGAIFEPDKVNPCKNRTRIMLIHNRNDDCFTWDERYVPMKESLAKNNYNLFCYETMDGGHIIRSRDVATSTAFFQDVFSD